MIILRSPIFIAISLSLATFGAAASGQAPQPAPDPADNPQFVGFNSLEKSLDVQFAEILAAFKGVWNIVLIEGADHKPVVTVGTLVGGLVLLGFGYVVAGIISRW